jgi:predicted dehydrogenase
MATVVALLGCSHPHSRMHLATLRVSPVVTGIRLWDPDRHAADALATDAGPKLLSAGDDFAATLPDDTEFALVCRRNDVNPETVVAAARAGKHVLSEKPVATTSANLKPVLEEVEKAGVTLAVCYPWRCHPAAVDLRQFVADGLIGRLLATEARMVTSQVRFRDPNHWLFSKEKAGGGILHWLGCHFFDLQRFILGEECTGVSAMTASLNGYPLEVEDSAAVAMRWNSGGLGTFSAGYQLPLSPSGYQGAAYDMYLAARGMEGSFAWSPTRGEERVGLQSAHPSWAGATDRERHYRLDPSEAYGGGFGLELFHRFIGDARAGRPPVASGLDALRVLEWVEAVYKSEDSIQRRTL